MTDTITAAEYRKLIADKCPNKVSTLRQVQVATKGAEVELTLPYPPVLNSMYRSVDGRSLISAPARRYKRLVQRDLRSSISAPIIFGPVHVRIDAYRPRKIGDIDGILKMLFDVLNGIVWNDDRQVVTLSVNRYDDKHDPRVVLRIQLAHLNGQGVWE